MIWKKLGLVYDSNLHCPSWALNSALTPTPIIHSSGDIRVYAGFRDKAGISRIGYVDYASNDPTKILRVSKSPVLDIGRAGCFDDNGVILGDIVRVGPKLYLFYVGFQLVARAKFIALTGLAYSNDEGETFIRTSEAPFLGRLDGQNMIAAVHSAHFLNDTWHLWYAAGDAWENIDGKLYPRYEIRHIRTRELSKISGSGEISVKPTYPEYRIGRPRVYMLSNELEMHFTSGSISGDYLPGRAFSKDGVTWFRDTHDFPLKRSVSGWDSIHLCYPSIIEVGGSKYMFYNGNHMGIDGFGCAVLEQD